MDPMSSEIETQINLGPGKNIGATPPNQVRNGETRRGAQFVFK
jgi:hypothetical protein